MKKTPLTSGRCLMVAAVSALLPLTAAQADDRDYRNYDQGTSGAQGPMRSDIDSSTPTYSGEERRQFQEETPGSQGPVRSDTPNWSSDSTLHEDSTRMPSQQQDPYAPGMRGAEGPTRSELEAQGYTGDRMSDRSMAGECAKGASETLAPNAYYGEANPLISGSADAKASFFGQGRWC